MSVIILFTAHLTGRKYSSSGTPGGQTVPALGQIYVCSTACEQNPNPAAAVP